MLGEAFIGANKSLLEREHSSCLIGSSGESLNLFFVSSTQAELLTSGIWGRDLSNI
jgi:hypothetical protein